MWKCKKESPLGRHPSVFPHPFSWDKPRKKRPYGSLNEQREFVFQNLQRNTTRFDAATTQCVTRNHRFPALNSIPNTCVRYVRESEMGALRPSLPFLILWTNIGRRILIEKIPNFLRVSRPACIKTEISSWDSFSIWTKVWCEMFVLHTVKYDEYCTMIERHFDTCPCSKDPRKL